MAGKKYNLDDALNTFFSEGRELLEMMEQSLLDLEKNPGDEELLNAVFRAAHTIKGSSGMFGLLLIEKFTHAVENVLDSLRQGEIELDADLSSLLFDCHDCMKEMIEYFDGHRDGFKEFSYSAQCLDVWERLRQYANVDMTIPVQKKNRGTAVKPQDEDERVINKCWHLSLRFGKQSFKNGLDPRSALSMLGDMGVIVRIRPMLDIAAPLADIDPEDCHLGFEIDFESYVKKEQMENVFEFFMEDSIIRILPPNSEIAEYVRLIESLPEEPRYIGEILKEIGSLTEHEVEEALGRQKESGSDRKGGPGKLLGEIIVEEKMVQKKVVEAAVQKQNRIRSKEELMHRSIKIDMAKLDKLTDVVGELVITAANVAQVIDHAKNPEYTEAISMLSGLVNDIRERSMNMRMVPIGEALKRFERMVRDIARSGSKEVDFIVIGGETELDKIMMDNLADPLMHLVRNAVDHGIESPEAREAAGKPRSGKVLVKAYNEMGSIVIEITDDGAGINKNRIISAAVSKGFIREDQSGSLSDHDIFNFIFMPGFSTADIVTKFSGRGVGLDVVKKNIDQLKGTIALSSKAGLGTTVHIQLPLTLAIINGFLFTAGRTPCVIPMDLIRECGQINDAVGAGIHAGGLFDLRGEMLPVMRVADFVDDSGGTGTEQNIIIVEFSGRKAGLLVDAIHGEIQAVVKPLGEIFKNLQWISGGTILGSGEIALILDVPKLIQYVRVMEKTGVR